MQVAGIDMRSSGDRAPLVDPVMRTVPSRRFATKTLGERAPQIPPVFIPRLSQFPELKLVEPAVFRRLMLPGRAEVETEGGVTVDTDPV